MYLKVTHADGQVGTFPVSTLASLQIVEPPAADVNATADVKAFAIEGVTALELVHEDIPSDPAPVTPPQEPTQQDTATVGADVADEVLLGNIEAKIGLGEQLSGEEVTFAEAHGVTVPDAVKPQDPATVTPPAVSAAVESVAAIADATTKEHETELVAKAVADVEAALVEHPDDQALLDAQKSLADLQANPGTPSA